MPDDSVSKLIDFAILHITKRDRAESCKYFYDIYFFQVTTSKTKDNVGKKISNFHHSYKNEEKYFIDK